MLGMMAGVYFARKYYLFEKRIKGKVLDPKIILSTNPKDVDQE